LSATCAIADPDFEPAQQKDGDRAWRGWRTGSRETRPTALADDFFGAVSLPVQAVVAGTDSVGVGNIQCDTRVPVPAVTLS
jgi:hypothetical protein